MTCEDLFPTLKKSKLENAKTQLEKENLELQYKPMQEVPEDFIQQEIGLKKLALESARKEYQTALESYQLLEKSTADINEAEAAVAQAKAALEKAERNLDDTSLKAPLDGTVLEIARKSRGGSVR